MKTKTLLSTLAVLGLITFAGVNADAKAYNGQDYRQGQNINSPYQDGEQAYGQGNGQGRGNRDGFHQRQGKGKKNKGQGMYNGHARLVKHIMTQLPEADQAKFEKMYDAHKASMQPLQEKLYARNLEYKVLLKNEHVSLDGLTKLCDTISSLRTQLQNKRDSFWDNVEKEFDIDMKKLARPNRQDRSNRQGKQNGQNLPIN